MDKRIEQLIGQIKSDVCIIAIDGRAAAGKTTLAENIANKLNTATIRMDDFFLPSELRKPDRLSEVGGNVHYERFIDEVLTKLNCPDEFEYRMFNCKTMKLDGYRKIPHSHFRVVEGSYCMHPKFGDYADVSIFCDIDETTQYERILHRNGEMMAERFKNEWIPMEERYFKEFKIRERVDIIL